MEWRYSEWDEMLAQTLKSFANLMSLFNYLLLLAGGKVDRAMEWLRLLQERGMIDQDIDLDEFYNSLEEQRIIQRSGDGYVLTDAGERNIRQDSLAQIFTKLKKGGFGQHRIPATGEGGEQLTETRPYRFGDPVAYIDAAGTIGNALRRGEIDDIRLTEEDFQVFETEHLAACATVLLIDISHSMILYGEDRITPAKQVALALSELILTRYPRDTIHVAVFGDDAWEIEIRDIPYLSVGPYHTNTKAGLQLAQSILKQKKHLNRQIFMITDGKPSAMYDNGELYRNPMGLDPKIVNGALEEAALCRRNNIIITTFMVAQDPELVDFVEQLTETNKGRAYYSSLESLGEYLFVDYVRNRRRRLR